MAAVALLGVLAGCAGSGTHSDALRVGVAYDVGGAGNPVNALTKQGLADARKQLGSRIDTVREFQGANDDTDEDRYDRLVILCQSGYDPVLAVGYLYAGPDPATGPLARAAQACPKTRFALVDGATVSAPNVADLAFADADGSYLMGVAAGLASRTGVVGFVGACQVPAVTAYATGFRAGVLAARPKAQVRTAWLASDPADCGDANASAELGQHAAGQLYAGGADVVYAVAGASGVGVFIAAKQHEGSAIGYGIDTYDKIGPVLQGAVLTSMLKRVDTAVAGFVTDAAGGRFTAGIHRAGLGDHGVGFADSGDLLTPYVGRLNGDKQKIIDGTIAVPSGA